VSVPDLRVLTGDSLLRRGHEGTKERSPLVHGASTSGVPHRAATCSDAQNGLRTESLGNDDDVDAADPQPWRGTPSPGLQRTEAA
jgi:hypothetical protein